jgi:hypothetical protein
VPTKFPKILTPIVTSSLTVPVYLFVHLTALLLVASAVRNL